MHLNPRRILPILVLILALAAAGYWYVELRPAQDGSTALQASGTIEVSQVQISPEVGGKVLEVYAAEGQALQRGQPLLRLDDTLMQAQLDQARAALSQAQANYALVAAGAPPEQRLVAVRAAELELLQAEQALEDLNETAGLAAAAASLAVAEADRELDRATQYLDNLLGDAPQADVDAAHAAVVLARKQLDDAQEDFRPYENKAEDNLVRAQLQTRLAAAQKAYDNLVTRYNNVTGTANQYELALAQAAQAAAQAKLDDARRTEEKLQNGPDPDVLALAQARVALAQAHLDAARAGPSEEQLALAQAQVESAREAVGTLELQLEKLLLLAPADALVMLSTVQPGEFVTPGALLFTLGLQDELSITIYVSEDRYGQISLGQQAQVQVDSFPLKSFPAVVTYIADRAEFTPRNVQTEEGRKNTVFAIQLSVDDPAGLLKSGMPADVIFEQ